MNAITQSTPKPSEWVDRLFARFTTMYGSLWIDRWRDAPVELVKAEWCRGLEKFDLPTIKSALDWCAENQKFPPTLPEFVDACRSQRVRPEQRLVEHPPMLACDPTEARKRIAELVASMKARH